MLVFLIILGVILIFSFITYFSTIKVKIEAFKIDNSNKLKINDFIIKIYIMLFGKIKLVKIKITKSKLNNMKKLKFNKLIYKITNLDFIEEFKKNNFLKGKGIIPKSIKGLKSKIESLDLNAEIGIENVILLSYLVAILDILIGINLSKRAKFTEAKKYKYTIIPSQTNKFYLKLSVKCIISIKISNIIKNVIQNRGNVKILAKTSCNIK